MDKVILKKINVRGFLSSAKEKAAQDKINEYIRENNFDVISVSLFIKNEDEYLFTLTTR